MSKFRTIKTNNIINADEHTENLKNKTIYNSAKNSTSQGPIYTDGLGCLQSTDSYNTLLSLMKGNNLCNQKDISYVTLQGQMNEANIMSVNTNSFHLVYPTTTSLEFSANTITQPIIITTSSQLNPNANPGVLIDPSGFFINKVICEPYIYMKDPSDNNYYDLSSNGLPETYKSYYQSINQANNQYPNFNFSSKINLN